MGTFEWELVQHDPAAGRARWRELAGQVTTLVPEAAGVLVTTRGGVSLLDEHGSCLDLDAVPQSLLEDLHAFFGVGVFWWTRVRVNSPYAPRSAPKDAP